MDYPVSPLPKRHAWQVFSSTITLAGWYLGQMWRLLISVLCGMLATVVLVCSIPLFSNVAASAGLQDVFYTTPGTPGLGVMLQTSRPSVTVEQNATSQIDAVVKEHFAPYLASATPTMTVQMSPLKLSQGNTSTGLSAPHVLLSGYDLDAIADHLTVVAGRLPQVGNQYIEVALTQGTLNKLGLQLGSVIETQFEGRGQSTSPAASIKIQIVGIITLNTPNEALWFHANYSGLDNFQPQLNGQYSVYPMLTARAALPPLLPEYAGHISLMGTVETALLLLMLGLVLFFVSIMAEMLVDYQMPVIATLRSRGGLKGQVSGIFTTQGVLLGLIAVLVGPVLAVYLVRWIVLLVLPVSAHDALNTISGNPIAVVLGFGWLALLAVVVVLLTMIFAIRRATQVNIVTLRRESARATRQALWRRIYLDIVLLGYVLVTVTQAGSQTALQSLPAMLNLLALLLLTPVVVLLFLRIFPFLLRRCLRWAVRSRGVTLVLSLVQMERAVGATARKILLLALATAFVIFTLTFITSQQNRQADIVDYRAGADFSGDLTTARPFAEQTAQYQQISGVISAALGYKTTATPANNTLINAQVLAVDADHFAQTAVWKASYAPQSLASLMALLQTHRGDDKLVYVVVDSQMLQTVGGSVGSTFVLKMPEGYALKCVIAATVTHIPGVYNEAPGTPGMLVDYQSYAAAYAQTHPATPLTPNYAWLQTNDDQQSLAHIREVLSTGPLKLGALQDRRAMLTLLQGNVLLLNVQSIQGMGAVAALFLALLGMLIASWLDISQRLIGLGVLRAMGMAPRKILSMFVWEQGVIYGSGLVLGILLSCLLNTMIAPLLITIGYITPFSNQNALDVPALQITIPFAQIVIVLGIAAAICACALGLMLLRSSRLVISQTLRLNED